MGDARKCRCRPVVLSVIRCRCGRLGLADVQPPRIPDSPGQGFSFGPVIQRHLETPLAVVIFPNHLVLLTTPKRNLGCTINCNSSPPAAVMCANLPGARIGAPAAPERPQGAPRSV